jgi:thioredoxin reductase
MQTDVAIIGAGPAGIAAGIQLKRYGIEPLIFEQNRIGGLLHNANLVENYPGFVDGITGPGLAELIAKQADKAGLHITYEKVSEIDFRDKQFVLETSKNAYHARFLIIASGTKPIKFNDFEIDESISEKIFYEIYPLLGESGKEIIIVGAGDAAFDYALNLARRNKVIILHRGITEKCLPLLKTRAANNPNIKLLNRTKIIEIAINKDNGLTVHCSGTEQSIDIEADYLVFALGREPQLDFINKSAATAELQLDGLLYFAGDVQNGLLRQTAIAVGDGVKAAMKVYRRLKGIDR